MNGGGIDIRLGLAEPLTLGHKVIEQDGILINSCSCPDPTDRTVNPVFLLFMIIYSYTSDGASSVSGILPWAVKYFDKTAGTLLLQYAGTLYMWSWQLCASTSLSLPIRSYPAFLIYSAFCFLP